jgi:hypothetical protein
MPVPIDRKESPMTDGRDTRGRFAAKPLEQLSPAYARRLLNALAKGKTRSEARGHTTTTPPAWKTPQLARSPTYDKALEVVRRTRHGESFSKASKAVGISPDTVLRYTGSAFERDTRGRWKAKATDRLYRSMRFLTDRGLTTVEPANSAEASKLATYWHAVDRYLKTGDDRLLRRFERMRLRTRDKTSHPFVTDRAQLERLGYAGEISFEDLYQS